MGKIRNYVAVHCAAMMFSSDSLASIYSEPYDERYQDTRIASDERDEPNIALGVTSIVLGFGALGFGISLEDKKSRK